MKDYYKTLGIRATASPEDIHARWIELMRKFHPDSRRGGGTEDLRIKEINEAYEVLKHSSARAHYDLQRTYYQKKRTLHLQRFILPPAIFLVILFLGLIYSQRSNVTPSPKSTLASVRRLISIKASAPNEINQIDETNESNQTNQIDVPNAPSDINEPNDPDDIDHLNDQTQKVVGLSTQPKITKSPQVRNDSSVPNVPNALNQKNQITKTRAAKVKRSPKPQKVAALSTKPKVTKSSNIPNRSNDLNVPNAPNALNQKNQINRINEINEINQINQIDQINQTDQIDKIDQTREAKDDRQWPIAHSLLPIAKLNTNAPNDPNELNHLSQLTSPPLLATEEEVKHFFALYRQRYNRKDIDALLSLFSPRVVQNQRDGFDEIKKTYSHFFDQSRQLRYNMKDMRIEIYQNAVEVWARYEIDQTLKKSGKEKAWRGGIRWILIKENGALKIRFLDYRPQESR